MSCPRQLGKIIVEECSGKPPSPENSKFEINCLSPPVIEMKGLIPFSCERGFSREVLLAFCKGMIENLPEGDYNDFFRGLYSALK